MTSTPEGCTTAGRLLPAATWPAADRPPVIVGGGHTGLLLALALEQAGLPVVLLDREPLEATLATDFDGRALGLMQGACRVLETLGLWSELAPVATPIWGVDVEDRGSGARIAYDARSVGDAPFGYGIETRLLRSTLLRAALARPGITFHPATVVTGLRRQPDRLVLALADGHSLATSLLLGADGRASAVRALAGIPLRRYDYRQTALTFAVRLRRPQSPRVRELLRPAGPLALLPIGPQLCSITWIEQTELAKALLAAGPVHLAAALQAELGSAEPFGEVVGRPTGHPLQGQLAARYIAPRVALAGDAAHGLHPIHAQGWNLGVRDVAALAEVLAEAAAHGQDPGSPEVLLRYQRWRAGDAALTFNLTDNLNRLFSNDLEPAKLLRSAGLGLVDRLAPLKRLVIRQGMGLGAPLGGRLPKLAQGQPLTARAAPA